MPISPLRRALGVFCLTFALAAAVAPSAAGQGFVKRYINRIVKDTADAAEPQFFIYPTVGYSPETNFEFGASALYVYYANRDTTNRLSEISAFGFYTLENQLGLWLENSIYTDKDKWFFLGRVRAQQFPLLYHGIGPNSPKEAVARVDANQLLVRQRVLRKFAKNLFFGPEVDYQQLTSVDFVDLGPTENGVPIAPVAKPRGATGSRNLGLGAGLVYDSRHNVLNVRNGFFSELAALRYSKKVGSDFGFTTVVSDTRIYRPVGRRNVFAAQLLGQFTDGGAPFNQLALFGGESIMRGYYLGRFRANNQVAAQAEMRFLPLPLGFSKRLGAVVFGGLGTVFNRRQNVEVADLKWSAGAGARFLLFPKKDVFTRFDVAFTEEKPGFYFFIGEAF